MKAQHERLKLRYDTVLVVTRITNECTGWTSAVARQIRRTVGELVAEQEFETVGAIHIGLVARASAVDITKIQRRRAEIGKSIRVAVLDEGRHRVKSDVVIDELAKISVERGNSALFGIKAVFGGIKGRRHCSA